MPESPKLLVAGGEADPNIQHFVKACKEAGVATIPCLVSHASWPSLEWSLDDHGPRLSDAALSASGIFLRRDVFLVSHDTNEHAHNHNTYELEFRAQAWWSLVKTWAVLNETVRVFNRPFGDRAFHKIEQLVLARALGLRTPWTLVTNRCDALRKRDAARFIAKPVAGGTYTASLDDLLKDMPSELESLPAPALIQRKLNYPEMRVYLVGDQAFAFEIRSSLLDYRLDREVELTAIECAQEVLGPLRKLAHHVGLDFCAADFKTDPDTGEWVFLEINDQPMFVAYDTASGGRLCQAMVRFLATGEEL